MKDKTLKVRFDMERWGWVHEELVEGKWVEYKFIYDAWEYMLRSKGLKPNI